MRIVPILFTVMAFILPTMAQADVDFHKYERKSESERIAWISRMVDQAYPDMDAGRKERIVPGIKACLEETADMVPFYIVTDVCIEEGAEEGQ